MVRELLTDTEIRYVWRHLPLADVHPHAQLAAEAAEAAAAQGAFWPMHDLLLQHQDALSIDGPRRLRAALGLDVDRFRDDLQRHVYEHAGRPGRRVGRCQRRVRHPDVLHQRSAALRGVRHRHSDQRRDRGASAACGNWALTSSNAGSAPPCRCCDVRLGSGVHHPPARRGYDLATTGISCLLLRSLNKGAVIRSMPPSRRHQLSRLSPNTPRF